MMLVLGLLLFLIQGILLHDAQCFTHNQWTMAVACGLSAWTVFLSKRFGYLLGLSFFAATAQASYTAFHTNPICQFMMDNMMLNQPALVGLLFILGNVAVCSLVREPKQILEVLTWAAIGDAALVLVSVRFGMKYGIISQLGYDAQFVALCLPLVKFKNRLPYFLVVALMATAIVFGDSTTALAFLVVFILWRLLVHTRLPRCYVLCLCGLFVAFCGWYLFSHPLLLDMGGRFPWWKIVLNEIDKFDTWQFLFGKGLGAYTNEFYALQMASNHSTEVGWFYAHNEFIQILYDYGLLGGLLFDGIILITLWRLALLSSGMALSFVMLCAMCLFHYPLRQFPVSLLFTALLATAYGTPLLFPKPVSHSVRDEKHRSERHSEVSNR